MTGKEFQEDAVLAAAKTLKTVEFSGNSEDYADVDRLRQSTAMQSVSGEAEVSHSKIAELFERHHDRVFRTAYRVTGSAADAEDVLQTVFVRIVRGHEAAANAENTEAYFTRAAINASVDLIRSRKRSNTFAVGDVENIEAAASFRSSQTPEREHEDRELRKMGLYV